MVTAIKIIRKVAINFITAFRIIDVEEALSAGFLKRREQLKNCIYLLFCYLAKRKPLLYAIIQFQRYGSPEQVFLFKKNQCHLITFISKICEQLLATIRRIVILVISEQCSELI